MRRTCRKCFPSKEFLKSCPFCGGVADVSFKYSYFSYAEFYVQCSECYAEIPKYRTEDEAIAHWNKCGTREDVLREGLEYEFKDKLEREKKRCEKMVEERDKKLLDLSKLNFVHCLIKDLKDGNVTLKQFLDNFKEDGNDA